MVFLFGEKEDGQKVSIVDNLSSMFVIALILVILAVLFLLVRKLMLKFEFTANLYTTISQKLFFNAICRVLIQGYLEFTLSATSVVSNWDDSPSVDRVFSLLMIIFILMLPSSVYFLLNAKYSELDRFPMKRFESLYLNIKLNSKTALLFTPLFLLRR